MVKEITAQAWTQEVNQAGEGIWVVVHLYDKGVMLSNILNKHFVEIANKYKYVKFVRGVASVSKDFLLKNLRSRCRNEYVTPFLSWSFFGFMMQLRSF